MKKVVVGALVVLVAVAASGCYGPQKLTTGIDDWANEMYIETPWLMGNVISYGILSFVTGIAWGIDGIINIYYFWVEDAQPFGDGKGTPHNHKSPAMPK